MGEKIPFSERVFFNFANRNEHLFRGIKEDLEKANIETLYQNYISKAIFYTFLTSFLAIGASLLTFYFTKNLFSFLILLIPIIVGIGFYIVPSLEAKNLSRKIDEELPFAVIYMAAIAQSNIEPVRMFRLLANSKEYPAFAFEVRKILKQVEFFGYNLADVLKDYSLKTKNEKLRELFSGIAINIIGGGSLKDFLEKKATNLLVEYRLERQSYNALAGTFLDVYISVLIVSPLLLIIVLVIMINSGFKIPMGVSTATFLFIVIIVLLNIIFLLFLEIKQPKA